MSPSFTVLTPACSSLVQVVACTSYPLMQITQSLSDLKQKLFAPNLWLTIWVGLSWAVLSYSLSSGLIHGCSQLTGKLGIVVVASFLCLALDAYSWQGFSHDRSVILQLAFLPDILMTQCSSKAKGGAASSLKEVSLCYFCYSLVKKVKRPLRFQG